MIARRRTTAALFALAVAAAGCEIEATGPGDAVPDQLADAPPQVGVERQVPPTSAPGDEGGGQLAGSTTTTAPPVPTTTVAAPTTTSSPTTTVAPPAPTTTAAPTTTTAAPPAPTTTVAPTTTTTPPTTTAAPTTTTTLAPTTTTVPPTTTTVPSGSTFGTLPPGADLPSGAWCATQVVATPEHRPENATANATRGTAPNGRYPRVDGDFVGTTDEIIQWAACKWGIDVDIARAQASKESWWYQSAGGDLTWDQSACHPDLRTSAGEQCPESTGLLQVRYLYHLEAFEDSNAILSTAYNIDYAYAVWRTCYNGGFPWLNDVTNGGWYEAGDLDGCMGVWFTGRWWANQGEVEYLAELYEFHAEQVWNQPWF